MNDQQRNHTLFDFMSLYDVVADYSWSYSIEKNSPTPQLIEVLLFWNLTSALLKKNPDKNWFEVAEE